MKPARIFMTVALSAIVLIASIIGLVQYLGHQVQGYQVDSMSQLGAHVCDAGQKIKNAADYKGNPPHKMSLVEESIVTQTKPNLTDYNPITLQRIDPKAIAAFYKFQQTTLPKDVSDTQLVGCIWRSSETDTKRTCAYDSGTLHVYSAQYRIDIYTATTHKLLKSTDIKSMPTDSYICPSSIYYDPKNNRQYVPYDLTDLLKIVQPFAQS